MTKYYDAYKVVFDQVKTNLEAISSLKNVVLGEQFKLTEMPMAVINPEPTEISQATIGSMLESKIGFSIILMIRETEPSNWFTDIVSIMGDVVDKILSNRTLNSAVKDVVPTFFSPGEIRTQGKLYFGGVVRFETLLFFTP
jgi:hypothetical protein